MKPEPDSSLIQKEKLISLAIDDNQPIQRELYPQTSDKVKTVVMWLGLGFVIMIILVQQISGYS